MRMVYEDGKNLDRVFPGDAEGILLYQCPPLNILEKGPMVTYGVETGHTI